MSSSDADVRGAVLLVIGCAGLTLLTISFVFALPVMIIGFGGWAFYRWYTNHPSVCERREREHLHSLYREAKRTTPTMLSKEEFGGELYRDVPQLPDALETVLLRVALDLYDAEEFAEPVRPPPPICNSMEGARYKDYLSAHTAKIADLASTIDALTAISMSYKKFLSHLPSHVEQTASFDVPLIALLDDPGQAIEDLSIPFFYKGTGTLFMDMCLQLEMNLHDVSGIPLTRENRNHPKLVLPSRYKGEDIADRYLKDTPLLDILNARVPFSVAEEAWFEHAWALAPPGTGKTQLIQYLVSERLPEVEAGLCSVIVMDSQGDLINRIRRLKGFAPEEPLHDKLIILEPSLEHPPALNLFDYGQERLETYSADDKEQFTNVAINQIVYVLDALMGEGGAMTAKQETLYRYIVRLLIEVPNASLGTFSDLLQITKREQLVPYQKHIDRLPEPAQEFFATQFLDKEFAGTRRQVAWRISRLRENTYFDRMFSHPRSSLDLFSELNSSKVILVNTDIKRLDEDGTNVFGRYFIGALLTASQERAALPRGERLPVYYFIDECHDYIKSDTKVTRLLDQARKMRISLFLAHQRSKQITAPTVLDALANTAVRFASTDNPSDAEFAARALHTTKDVINSQPKQHFALYVRRQTPTAVSVKVPFLVMEEMEQMTEEEQEAVMDAIHARYAVAPSEEEEEAPKPSAPESDDTSPPETPEQQPHDDPDNPPTDTSHRW